MDHAANSHAMDACHNSDEVAATVPSWLLPADGPAYEPPTDRDGFLRRNVLRLTSLLSDVQVGAASYASPSSPVDRVLRAAPTPLRLLGLVACIVMTTSCRNMLFAYLALAGVLGATALRPAEDIARQLRPTLMAVLVAALVMTPAALLGAPSSLVRMVVRVFVSVSLVMGLSQTVPWNQLVGALRWWHLPATFVLVIDLALKDLALLGRTALGLSEALSLRSVGRDSDKTAGAAGVMGMCFLRAHALSGGMSDAMACRGFDGTYQAERERVLTPAGAAYLVALACVLACYLWLEGAM